MFDYILDFIMGRFIYCPRCLKRLPIRSEVTQDMSCEQCQYPIPLAYISGCQEAPPVFVQVFGLPGSGKTTFLDMLGLLLHDLDHVWQESEYYSRPLTQQTMEHTTTLLTQRGQGGLAGSTVRRAFNQTEVLIFDLRNMPRWGSRTLVIMDHAGEQFAQLNLDLADIPFLQHTPITILLLSLNDLTSTGQRVDDLIASYLSTLKKHNVHPAKQCRQLIIAFSKADLLTNLPPELSSYLSRDTSHLLLVNRQGNLPLSEEQLPNYLQGMQQISDSIRTWVETLPNGINMLNMLADASVETRFTLVSAMGSPLPFASSGSALAPSPRRMLDPFFWVLEYYRSRSSRSTVSSTQLLGKLSLILNINKVALSIYQRAITHEPQNPDLFIAKGKALLGLKRGNEALTSYQQATHLAPDSSAAYKGKGRAFEQLAQQIFDETMQQAHQSYEKAKQLGVE